ncbi:MAG: polysaccharide biosynthesis/export family protein [Steroidobacteraceae bacterium]|jgi:polysaccharide export outer membrane protein
MKQIYFLVILLSACWAPAPAAEPGGAPAVPEGYRLHPGDVLLISVWNEKDLQSEVVIRPDGGITFPLAGELQAADKTIADLTAELQTKIRKYIPDAVATVIVKAVLGNRVYVIGKVNRPGDFPLNGPLDVMQALALAGGATPFADLNGIRVLRRDGARQTSISFRYGDIQHGRKLDRNILLQSGDTVVVP